MNQAKNSYSKKKVAMIMFNFLTQGLNSGVEIIGKKDHGN